MLSGQRVFSSLMKRLKAGCRRMTGTIRMFTTLRGLVLYYYCILSKKPCRTVRLGIRNIPFPLLCRAGFSDAAVLRDTFYKAYHLPPVKLRETPVIVDLGANVGYTSVDFAAKYPRAKIIAVEMDTGSFEIARINLQPFQSRCTLINAAVWSTGGEVFYDGDEAWSQRVVSRPAKRAKALTIDELFKKFELGTVDFLKMDIEGAEAEIFKSLTWLDQVITLKVEIHPPAEFEVCRQALENNGFKVARTTWNLRCLSATRLGEFKEPSRGEAQ